MEIRELIWIWTWRYRECYAVEWSDLCIKKVKPLSANIRSIIANLLRDINQEEIDVFNSIPPELKDFFPTKFYKDWAIIISERPRDFDGNFSRTLNEYSGISNSDFWTSVDMISETLLSNKLYFFDIFHNWNNIVVQKVSKYSHKPIIIDCKRHGWSSYPLQINLLLDSEKEKKFKRRLERFKLKYKI